jgi:hypothetical protein
MSKSYLTPMAILLIWASTSFGQGQDAPTSPAPENAPEPPSAAWNVWDRLKSCCFAETGPAKAGVFTADAEYLLWFLASNRDSRPIASTDFLGAPRATILAALANAEHGRREPGSGGRFTLGYWQVQDNVWIHEGIRDVGAETVFFFMGQRSVTFRDTTSPDIIRPFFDLNNRQESGFPVAVPGLSTGGIQAHAQVNVWGAEVNLWKNVFYDYPGTSCTVNLMAGFRYLEMDDRLNVDSISVFNQNLAAFPPFVSLAGNTVQVFDAFATHNHFYGAQVGVAGKWWPIDKLVFEAAFKVGIGSTQENLEVGGSQLRTLPNGTKVFSPAGLLALPSNIGNYNNSKFAQVPELSVKLSTPVTSNLTLSGGFSALYWSRLLRPGHQVERDLDITQIPNFPPGATATPTGLGQPSVPFKQSDLWLLGISVGAEIRW